MKSKNIFCLFTTVMMLLLNYNCEAQIPKNNSTLSSDAKIEVIQFHSEHRCMTCNKIEILTKEALKAYPNISFFLVNVDDKKNAKMAEQFEATGTALFLYNPKTGKKKDLTDFAFMNAKSKPEEFKKGLINEIKNFK